jgi:hypothetical protein
VTTFTFDAGRHDYRIAGRVVPSISAILRTTQEPIQQRWFTPEHRARGTAVHLATLMLDLGAVGADEALAALRPEWRPYLRAYLDFVASSVR